MRILARPRRRGGFTMVEVMIAVAISTLITMAVASTMFISGRAIKEMNGQTITRSSRTRAIDQVRYRLADAEIGSVTEYQADFDLETGDLVGYHRIEFTDPTNGGATSAFYFNTAENTLYYDADVADGEPAEAVVVGPINLTFVIEAQEIIELSVRTESTNAYGGDVDTQDGTTKIYLRNLPPA
jgi:prepilin-type N-terminal cleavage/methylation domain-containing protein